MKDSLRTVIYALVMGTVCALLLTAAASFTAPYQEANKQAEQRRSILAVLEVPVDEGTSRNELISVFDENVVSEQRGDLSVFLYKPDSLGGAVQAVAVKFEGPGLWGPIKGFLALGPDMKVIRGIVFTEQEETPGLGGDIATPGFQDQFTGKAIEDASGQAGIRIVRTGASAENEVDAITGATITCNKVEALLNATIDRIVEARSQ